MPGHGLTDHPAEPAVELGQALFVLSDALDLVGIDDVLHGKRVAWLAQRLVEAAGRPELLEDARNAALVHDCGVSSSRHHLRLVLDLGLGDRHSELGAGLLERFAPLAHLAEVVRHHHTPWPRLGTVKPRAAFLANAIFLADRVDVLQARLGLRAAAALRAAVRAELLGPHGDLFHPRLVDALHGLLEGSEVEPMVLENGVARQAAPPGSRRVLTMPEVRELAWLFAQTVDAKSAYTAAHSHGVAALAVHLGRQVGLAERSLHLLEVSALLHDLGKLRVPDEVLEKPGPLTPEERVLIQAHAGDSRAILARIDGFEWIAAVAGMHHECLDGTGYPDRVDGGRLPLEARIVTVADIFQALAQDRPYRRAMLPAEILPILQRMAGQGKIDASLVACVRQELPRCWDLALVRERGASGAA